MLTDTERQAATEFVYREARLADEARYAEWHALWTDDAVYWVPATTDPAADPEKHLSHIYDNRARLDTRIKLLQTGHRYSQEPASAKRRVWLVGSCSDRPIAYQQALWERLGIAADFTTLKHRLADLKARFPAAAYYHVGDTDLDADYATGAGFRFLRADAAAHRAWV